jgi:hypothetical protein
MEMTMKLNSKLSIPEPPLKKDEQIEVDPDTGGKIYVTITRRGILTTESRRYDSIETWARTFRRAPAKMQMERFCEELRDDLRNWGLPTDREFRWVKIGDGEWQQYPDDLPFDPAHSWQLWYARLVALTEPLTEARFVGDALYRLTNLLSSPGVEPFLEDIAACIQAVSTLRIAGSMNAFATAGMAARKGRAAGPAAKQRQAAQRREVTWAIANRYWRNSPLHRGDAANTAAAIREEVNRELRAKGLLPRGKEGLSVKALNDYIRAYISEELI